MRKYLIKRLFALVLVAAMVIGVIPQMQLFAAEDDEYDDISGHTNQVSWDPDTTNYVARRASVRFVGTGPNSIFESAGYRSTDYEHVRSSSYDKINNPNNNYLYPQGVIIDGEGGKKTGVPGIATLLNLGTPFVHEGYLYSDGSYKKTSSTGTSHPGILDPLKYAIFSLEHYDQLDDNGYGEKILQNILAATYKYQSWFSVSSSSSLTTNFTLKSGADYAYQIGKNSDGATLWFEGWYKDTNDNRRAYGTTDYWTSVGKFINKSYNSLTASRQIKLPGYAQGSDSAFSGNTKTGIELNNEQGVDNTITVHYAKPVVFATDCESCFNEYYNNRGMNMKGLITGSGDGFATGEVITKGSSSNNYTLTVKKCSRCINPNHKDGDDCHIWLVPGQFTVSADVYDNGNGSYLTAPTTHSVTLSNDTSSTDRYVTLAQVVYESSSKNIPQEVTIDGVRGKFTYSAALTPSYTTIGTDGKTSKSSIRRFGTAHYNENGNANEYYQLLVYEHKVVNPDINLKFYINGKRTWQYHDSDGNLVTVNASTFEKDFDKIIKEGFKEDDWIKKTPLSIAQTNDALKNLPIPKDANISWINYGDDDRPLANADAYTSKYHVANPNSVVFAADLLGSSGKGKRLYDITASNIVASEYDDITIKVNVTFPDSLVTVRYLNINDNTEIKTPVTFPFIQNEKGSIPLNISAKVNGELTTFKYNSYEFAAGTSDELIADMKVTKPTSSSPDGYAKVLASHNRNIILNVYYDVDGEHTLTMEYYKDGISSSDENEAHALKEPVTVLYKNGGNIPYPEIIEKNGKVYLFSRYDQNGVSETYVKHDATNRKANIIKDGKKNEKVKVYYKEAEVHFYTVHFVKVEAGKNLDQCSELYATDKAALAATGNLKVTVSTSGISELDGYERDTSATPIDIHGTKRNNGSVTGSSSITYTGSSIESGYDYDIYIPYKQKEKANTYTIHYMFKGSEIWKEGPYNFQSADYNSDESLKKSVNITTEKTIGGTTYRVDTADTSGRYDRHGSTIGYGSLSGSKYKTADGIKKGYDYEIYIPLKIGTQVPEYVLHYYKGTTSNVLYSQELGNIPDGDVGKKKTISWNVTADSSDIEVTFPLDLYQDGYTVNYTGQAYDQHNGIMQRGTFNKDAKTYTTYSNIEKSYRYDFYIPVTQINGEPVTIMYEYVDAETFEPLWSRGVYVTGLDLSKEVQLNVPNLFQLPENCPQALRELGWEYNVAPGYYKRRAWTSTYGEQDGYILNKSYTELNGHYSEYTLPAGDQGYINLQEKPEWDYMKIIIPLVNKKTSNRKVNLFYYIEAERIVNGQPIYYDVMVYHDTMQNVGAGMQTFSGPMYVTLSDNVGTKYPSGTILEVDYIDYPEWDTVTQTSGSYSGYASAMTVGGSSYVFCEKCRDYYRSKGGYTWSGTMHHTVVSPEPIEDDSTTWTADVDGAGKVTAKFTANINSSDSEVDVFVKLTPRSYVPMMVVYFEDGNPNHVLYTEEVAYDTRPEINTHANSAKNGGPCTYAFWQEFKGMPEVVMDSTGKFWEPAYMTLEMYSGTCTFPQRSTFSDGTGYEYYMYDRKEFFQSISSNGMTQNENHSYFCGCGECIGISSTFQMTGQPTSTTRYLWGHSKDNEGHKLNTYKRYNKFSSSARMFAKTSAPSYSAAEDRGFDFNENSHTLYLYYRDGSSTTLDSRDNYTTGQHTYDDSGNPKIEPPVDQNNVLYMPCKPAKANTIDVKYVTLNADGEIDTVVLAKDKAIIVKQGDTDFSYKGAVTIKGTNGREYNVTGTGQVLAYKDINGYAPYKGAIADSTNLVGQAMRYTLLGSLGTWTGTKPYQPTVTTTTDGVLYIPVDPKPDLTVKVRYVVYGEKNTVIKEEDLPAGLATEKDITITLPAELKHPTTGDALVPISTDYDIALYGKETATFFSGITYEEAEAIRAGGTKTGYIFEEVLAGGSGKVHFIIPYLGFDKTDAVIYIPYEPSTTKVDVKYITIRENGTWRRTIKTEDEVELERGSNFTYTGSRTITADGWTFEVTDSIKPVMSYNGASYDHVSNNPGAYGQNIDYDGFSTWTTTEKLNVERATLYIPVHIIGGSTDEGEEEGTDPTDVPEDTEDTGVPGLTTEETGRTDGLDWGNWCEDPVRPVPDRTSGGLLTGRDNAYAFIYHNIYSVSDAIPSGTNSVKGAINTFPFLAGATYSTVSTKFNYHIRNTITFKYTYYTASDYSWDWKTENVEDEDGFHTEFTGYITLPTFEEHTDTVTYEFGFDIPGTSDPYVTDINLSVASLEGGQITNPALGGALTIGKYTLGKTQKKDGTFNPQALTQYDYSETREKIFTKPTITAAGGTYKNKDDYDKALAEVKAAIAAVSTQPGEVRDAANKAYADAKINPASSLVADAISMSSPDHAQLWVDGTNYINVTGSIVPLDITRTTYDSTNSVAVPKEDLNGIYDSTFTTDYKYYINELNLAEVDPSGDANPVYVHTPVYTEVTVECDNIKYDQTKQAGLPSFILVNGTSDSYGSENSQNDSNDFVLTVANEGQHLEYPGYGNRDYAEYVITNGNQVSFDCDMWMDVGNDGNPANDLLIPAGMWAYIKTGTEDNKGRFYLPEWVEDGTHSYVVRTIAYNNTVADIAMKKIGTYGQETANTSRMYDPENTGTTTAAYISYARGEFTVIGKLYGLTLTDVNDTTNWKNVFRASGKEPKLYSQLGRDLFSNRVGSATDNTSKDGTGLPSSAAFDKNLAYYYRFGTFNEYGLSTGRMIWGSLPMLKGYNPTNRTEGTLKAGYTWTFKVDTVGTQTVPDDAVIEVEPVFSWMSLDGKTRIDNVKLYYSETVDGKKYTLTRVGSQSDLGNIKTSDVGNVLISTDELKNTAKIKGYGVSGGPKLADYLDLEGEIFRYGKFSPSVNFKTFSNLNYYGDISGRGIAKKALADGTLVNASVTTTKAYLKQLYGSDAKAETELSKLKQSYYFNYRLPKEFYVYPADKTPSTLKDLKAEKMNDGGYLVVSFKIHSVVNGTEYLYYWDGNTNMWNLETGSTNGTLKRTDAAGTEFTIKNGDVAIVEIVKGGDGDTGTVLK